jgi:hypothetical protein
MARGSGGGRGGDGFGGGGRGGVGGGGGRLTAGQRPVTEGTRIAIDVQLANFKHSDESEIVFPADMNNHDRAVAGPGIIVYQHAYIPPLPIPPGRTPSHLRHSHGLSLTRNHSSSLYPSIPTRCLVLENRLR